MGGLGNTRGRTLPHEAQRVHFQDSMCVWQLWGVSTGRHLGTHSWRMQRASPARGCRELGGGSHRGLAPLEAASSSSSGPWT